MPKLRDLMKMTTAVKTPSKRCFFQRGGSDTVASLSTSGSKDTATLKSLLRQVARQLPPHDLDQRYCTSLKDDDEKTTMKEFVETALLRAVGQGRLRRRDSTDPVVPCHQVHMAIIIVAQLVKNQRF
jgi:PET Domain